LVVASAVEHQPAVLEFRPVDYRAVGDRPRPGKLLELDPCRARVALALVISLNHRFPAAHEKRVTAFVRDMRGVDVIRPTMDDPRSGHKFVYAVCMRGKASRRASTQHNNPAMWIASLKPDFHANIIPKPI